MVNVKLALIKESKTDFSELPPLTRRAMELASEIPPLPDDWDYRTELANILTEKIGANEYPDL